MMGTNALQPAVQRRAHLTRAEPRYDAISAVAQIFRRVAAFLTFRRQHRGGALGKEDLIRKCRQFQAKAQADPKLTNKARGIWKLESLGFAYANSPDRERSLAIDELDHQLLPILHVGAGLASIQNAGFEPTRLLETVGRIAHPEYRQFPLETAGAMLAHYTDGPSFIRWMLGLQPLKAPGDPASFISAFDAETLRVMSHGYGRIIYFSRFTLVRALADVFRRSYLDHSAAVQGIAFAYTLANFADVVKVLETAERLRSTAAARPFQAGVVYALVAVEWTIAGWLDGFVESRGPRLPRSRRTMLELAQANLQHFRRQGRIDCFRLAIPPAAAQNLDK